jgi:hypothetical protein
MSRTASPALRGTLLGRLLNLWNPVMKRLLRSPLHWPWSRWFTVVEWTGRRSGRRYSTPVAYLVRGAEMWVTTGDSWWKNLPSNPLTHVWLEGRQVAGDATVVTDPHDSVQLHTTMFEAKPFFARLAGLPGKPGESQIATAVNAGRMLIRIRLRLEATDARDEAPAAKAAPSEGRPPRCSLRPVLQGATSTLWRPVQIVRSARRRC